MKQLFWSAAFAGTLLPAALASPMPQGYYGPGSGNNDPKPSSTPSVDPATQPYAFGGGAGGSNPSPTISLPASKPTHPAHSSSKSLTLPTSNSRNAGTVTTLLTSARATVSKPASPPKTSIAPNPPATSQASSGTGTGTDPGSGSGSGSGSVPPTPPTLQIPLTLPVPQPPQTQATPVTTAIWAPQIH
ncbi:hypothetical protein G7Y89_g14478 [Cudoniella acicularis]|uniref:Uncharacterized protein n=1 Tax=Cudoniella acicularis TaxID=354080 RepID=A0A8H4R1M7_9HELO|nr:hypothetical protein G7Y89_g14478 [Cudoniella acicularis]